MKLVRYRTRSGMILVAVLASLLVAVSIVFAGVRSLVRAHRECKDARVTRQTQLLVEAGVSRALEQLSKSNSYQGEIWQPKIATDEVWKPTVVIREEPLNEQTDSHERSFTVVAKLESNTRATQSTQLSFQFTIHPSEP